MAGGAVTVGLGGLNDLCSVWAPGMPGLRNGQDRSGGLMIYGWPGADEPRERDSVAFTEGQVPGDQGLPEQGDRTCQSGARAGRPGSTEPAPSPAAPLVLLHPSPRRPPCPARLLAVLVGGPSGRSASCCRLGSGSELEWPPYPWENAGRSEGRRKAVEGQGLSEVTRPRAGWGPAVGAQRTAWPGSRPHPPSPLPPQDAGGSVRMTRWT